MKYKDCLSGNLVDTYMYMYLYKANKVQLAMITEAFIYLFIFLRRAEAHIFSSVHTFISLILFLFSF